MEVFINRAIELAKAAYDHREFPVGALVVKDNTIIAVPSSF